LRSNVLLLLYAALEMAHDAPAVALEKGKAAAQTTDEFVHENPWKAVAVSAVVGLLLGMLISRK
jgi:ElaB/YqjD/DUF883 family membrane-anchored ribosome-binding protein